jgi:hypothetical protein
MKLTSLMNTVTCKLVLLLSGLVACVIAAMILFAPEVFYAANGVEIAGNIDLANELKAPAGALFVAGLLMIAGVFRRQLTVVALVTATVVYLSYGLSRLLSIGIDGMPSNALVGAAVFEVLLGAICLVALLPELNQRDASASR